MSMLTYLRKSAAENWGLFRRNRMGMLGLGILLGFAFLALLAPLPPLIDEMYHPLVGVDPEISYSVPPSLRHPMGTDFMGRDLLSQFLSGAQVAFTVGITAAVMSVLIGTAIGLISGYYGRAVDTLLMRLADIVLVLPGLPFIIVIAAAVGKLSIWIIVFLIAVLGWPGIARVIRAQTLSLRERPFVEAARVAGASNMRIIFHHIAPNVLPFTFLYAALGVSGAILTEAALSFLGLGDPGVVSWGMMLQWAFTTGHTFRAPYWILPPGLGISLLSLSFYLIGRAMDEIINPRLREP